MYDLRVDMRQYLHVVMENYKSRLLHVQDTCNQLDDVCGARQQKLRLTTHDDNEQKLEVSYFLYPYSTNIWRIICLQTFFVVKQYRKLVDIDIDTGWSFV